MTEEWLSQPETKRQGMALAHAARSALFSMIAAAAKSTDPSVVRAVAEYESFNDSAKKLGCYVKIEPDILPKEEKEEDANG
jgi:hypothetical protein